MRAVPPETVNVTSRMDFSVVWSTPARWLEMAVNAVESATAITGGSSVFMEKLGHLSNVQSATASGVSVIGRTSSIRL